MHVSGSGYLLRGAAVKEAVLIISNVTFKKKLHSRFDEVSISLALLSYHHDFVGWV